MVDDNCNVFARLYDSGQLLKIEVLNPAPYIGSFCSMTTNDAYIYNQLAPETGSFHKKMRVESFKSQSES